VQLQKGKIEITPQNNLNRLQKLGSQQLFKLGLPKVSTRYIDVVQVQKVLKFLILNKAPAPSRAEGNFSGT